MSSTVLVANIPASCAENELRELFSSAGMISKLHSPEAKAGASNKIAYVTYGTQEESVFAVKKLNKSILSDSRLTVRLAYKNNKTKGLAKEDGDSAEHVSIPVKSTEKEVKTGTDNSQLSKPNRKARLIVRNLSFKSSKEELLQHFSKFGKVAEVNILRKEDGKLKGCCFIQFDSTLEATKALKNTNAQLLNGRIVAVDWALPKTQFQEKTKSNEDPEGSDGDSDEENTEEEKDVKVESEDKDSAIESAVSDVSDGEEEDDPMEDDEDGALSNDEPKDWEGDRQKEEPIVKKKSNDVQEGKTLFLRNLPLETTQEELKKEMEKFGRVSYALLCIDKMLERPRGTGFVKFQTKESADACLEASTNEGVVVDGRQLNVSVAISRDELTNREKEKKDKGKDKRNLYLAREGMIRLGTLSAEGVSKTDTEKRNQLDRLKKQLLKNLHMFISPERLCIHNLPSSFDDKQLKSLFRKYAPKGALITEARAMKDFKNLNDRSQPKSKGYGFVAFSKHEDALAALRRINNNPIIFTDNKRPIVEFSIENRTALRAREKRLERSQEVLRTQSDTKTDDRPPKAKRLEVKHKPALEKGVKEENFTGALSDPKQKGLPSHMGPKIRHNRRDPVPDLKKKNKITRNSLRKDRPKPQKREAPQMSANVEPPAKKTRTTKKAAPKKDFQDKSKFSSLVESYKAKLTASSNDSRKKWFSD